jgi:hypothetical protein
VRGHVKFYLKLNIQVICDVKPRRLVSRYWLLKETQ